MNIFEYTAELAKLTTSTKDAHIDKIGSATKATIRRGKKLYLEIRFGAKQG